jgi:hypothetical protein
MDFQASANGEYTWLVQLKDMFSRYIWLIPLKNKKAATIAEAIHVWIGQNGRP